MYVRNLQLINYGPIPNLNIRFPFAGELPKPVVFVGANGSGKSIVLSHIVNGLLAAHDAAFPASPEMEQNKVYKLRSDAYIRSGSPYYLARVEYDDHMNVGEIRTMDIRSSYPDVSDDTWPAELKELWNRMPGGQSDHFESSFPAPPPYGDRDARNRLQSSIANRCILYFPFNRFEEPAWLNEANLLSKVRATPTNRIADETNRRVVASSPLLDNQSWLFEVVYDRSAFEIQTRQLPLPLGSTGETFPLPVFAGFQGDATIMHDLALQVFRIILGRDDARFGIGTRHGRQLTLEIEAAQQSLSVFQMSSGEAGLLDLFLSILRDYDLSRTNLSHPIDISGTVVIDEIDLHLHVAHQRDVLPALIEMFPKVQFVVTTHSPLFVLGMNEKFGEQGFAVHRLPEGEQIGPEEFSEFGRAYEAFMDTQRAQDEVREAVRKAQRPIVFVEGPTDVQYVKRAAVLLGKDELMERLELRAGGSDSKLDAIWKAQAVVMRGAGPITIGLVYDCDARGKSGRGEDAREGNVFRRFMPMQDDHPVRTGIENLFSLQTLQKARDQDGGLFMITPEHPQVMGEEERLVPEEWMLRSDSEKQPLCDLLCSIGDESDFAAFEEVFQIIAEAIG